jgi:hypothetical protein
MKTELIHSYSTASLSALAKSDSCISFGDFHPGGYSSSSPNTPPEINSKTSSNVDLVKAVAKEWWTKTARRKTVRRIKKERKAPKYLSKI